uniref:Uncharacterized protein n=1 Tax=Brassica oleracea var. oleracea TaxID=109376 RepID=A0A0D3DW78_BRAOL
MIWPLLPLPPLTSSGLATPPHLVSDMATSPTSSTTSLCLILHVNTPPQA